MVKDCKEADLLYTFTKDEEQKQWVEIKCKGCGIKADIPSSLYFKKWNYPVETEKLSPFEWLHAMEKIVGRDRMMKIKISFIDTVNKVHLGTTNIPYDTIMMLNVGDVLEFKEVPSIFGQYKIQSFAVNQGYPEGQINLTPFRPKAKIKLQQYNGEYADSLLPF